MRGAGRLCVLRTPLPGGRGGLPRQSHLSPSIRLLPGCRSSTGVHSPGLSILAFRNSGTSCISSRNRHVDYSNITPIAGLSLGDDTTVIGKVTSSETARIGRPPGAARVTLNDSTGLLNITWWGQAYLASRLRPGTRLAVSGRVSEYRGRAQMENPEYEELKGFADELVHAGNLLPIYPSTEGLQQRTIRNAARKALDAGAAADRGPHSAAGTTKPRNAGPRPFPAPHALPHRRRRIQSSTTTDGVRRTICQSGGRA